MIFKDHVKAFSDLYFPNFPREGGFPTKPKINGIPARLIYNSFEHFIGDAMKYHKVAPSYMILYTENILDKIWGDYDGIYNRIVFNDVKNTYNLCIGELDIDPNHIAVTYTGMKGYHLFIENKQIPFRFDGYGENKTKDDLDTVLSYLNKDNDTADAPLFGDTNRLFRVPGILRQEQTFCAALNPEELFEYTSFNLFFKEYNFNWSELFKKNTEFLEERYDAGYGIGRNRKAVNHVENILNVIEQLGWKSDKKRRELAETDRMENDVVSYTKINSKNGFAKVVDKTLRALLSKQNYYNIHVPNPMPHHRITYALRLMNLGFTIDDIVQFTSTLDWIDFDPVITRKELIYLKKKYL
jgi:hypothetical protein